jgi:hypothetical protein
MSDAVVEEKKKRERSPGYPAIDLEQAITYAQRLYSEERRHATPVDTALKHWGFSPQSGAGYRAVSALQRFGLIADEGSGPTRKVRLTDDAYNIIIDDRPSSEERPGLIQEAALRPPIHAALWQQYGSDLPSDANLKYELRKRGFTEGAAQEVIDEYRATLAYAGLSSDATLTEPTQDKEQVEEGSADDGSEQGPTRSSPRKRRKDSGMTVLSFQVSDRLVEVAVDGGPLTKGEIETLKAYLAIQEKIAPEEHQRLPAGREEEYADEDE